ncbi:F-box/kelch-repeat protein At3g06240-like [Rhododendron vialii]|uniref:F-box/kelch-repeat protein At3g06240-like n=1 Tax=Rhododendron vialii TaxID=182163 RepID=UPI00265F1DF4|nr:F-box/kelch-repeat protein At3g06240-like [Rhododendron vialii]
MSLVNEGFSNGPINLDFPFLNRKIYLPSWDQISSDYFFIAGICNGLVCINVSRFGWPLILCNPSTRQFRVVPGARRIWAGVPKLCFDIQWLNFGFGFHPSANDYKLIRIVRYFTPTGEDNIRVDLYAMSSETWSEIDVNKVSLFFRGIDDFGENDALVEFCGSSASVVLNGVFYWPAIMESDQLVVMSFDMGDEVFRKIRTPECLDGTWDEIYWQFTELDDKLALVVSRHESGFDVWVLNENESSWTNQIKGVSVPRIASDMAYGEYSECTVVGGRNNGELLVAEHKVSGYIKLFSYDTKTRQTMDLCFGHVQYESCLYFYTGTLLPVMQANEVLLN